MTKEERIAAIEKEEEKLYDKLHELDNNSEIEDTLEEFENNRKPYTSKLFKLDREKRMLMEPEYSKLPSYGTIFSLENFIEIVNDGGFIDYDGVGYYVKDSQMSNIAIHPSDVKAKSIRKDFDKIIWFNR